MMESIQTKNGNQNNPPNDLNTIAPMPKRSWSNPWILPAVGLASVGAYIIGKYLISKVYSTITDTIITPYLQKLQPQHIINDIGQSSLENISQNSNVVDDTSTNLSVYVNHYVRSLIIEHANEQ